MKIIIVLPLVLVICLQRNYVEAACLNSDDWYYESNKDHGCQWVRMREYRRKALCKLDDVEENCPQSCGICCDNDPKYKIFNSRNQVNCGWIVRNQSNKLNRREKFCDRYNGGTMVRNACPESCDLCFMPTSVPSPTSRPTTSFPTEIIDQDYGGVPVCRMVYFVIYSIKRIYHEIKTPKPQNPYYLKIHNNSCDS